MTAIAQAAGGDISSEISAVSAKSAIFAYIAVRVFSPLAVGYILTRSIGGLMAFHATWTKAMISGLAIADAENGYRVAAEARDGDRAGAAVTTAQGFVGGDGPGTSPDVLAPYRPGNKIVIQARGGACVPPS